MITVINQDRRAEQTAGHGANGRLWLPESEVERITGWSGGEQGLRDGEAAVSIPAGKRAEFLREGEANIAGVSVSISCGTASGYWRASPSTSASTTLETRGRS